MEEELLAASVDSPNAQQFDLALMQNPNNKNQNQTPNQPQTPTSQVSKYSQLLQVLEEMGKDIRPTYSGNKSSAERLKRCIAHSRILVRECLMETERSGRQ